MPHVIEMERNGVTFANYFVTDSLWGPSRSSIFIGQFPHDTAHSTAYRTDAPATLAAPPAPPTTMLAHSVGFPSPSATF